eukprot:scaffold1709_cov95-Cylindrotheca_fusiformis.AAC.2
MTDDVVNSWGVTSDSLVYLDSKLHIATYQAQVLSMEPVYLCNNLYSNNTAYDDDDNENDDENEYNQNYDEYCPSAGIYEFTNLPLQLPSIPNMVYGWAATGWTGTATIDMYLDSDQYQLIGRCQFDVVTHQSNSTSSSRNGKSSSVMKRVPEAKTTGMIAFGTLAALCFMCTVGSYLGGEFDEGADDDEEEIDYYHRDDDGSSTLEHEKMGFTRMMGGENA